jgi:hypothetical protein
MPRFRPSILWLAAIFVVTGSALGFAQVGDIEIDVPTDVPTVLPTVLPTDAGDDVREADKASKPDRPKTEASEEADASGERKLNHGFYVSQAAHCEDVDDPATPESPDFEAPDDCEGAGHGAYVSSVAKSSAGKKEKK